MVLAKGLWFVQLGMSLQAFWSIGHLPQGSWVGHLRADCQKRRDRLQAQHLYKCGTIFTFYLYYRKRIGLIITVNHIVVTVQLHVFQCMVLLSQFCQSVYLSVCVSDTCIVTKLNDALRLFWYHTKEQSLKFSDTQGGWWAMFPSLWNICQKWPTLFEKRRLWLTSAYNVSTVQDSEKVQLWQIESRSRAFQQAIDRVRTLPLSPEMGGYFVF